MTTAVYHLPNSRASSNERNGWHTRPAHPAAYHIDRACRYIAGRDRVRESTKTKAERRGLGPCSACVKDDDAGGSWQPQQCPVCGEDTDVQLATHIRKYCTGT